MFHGRRISEEILTLLYLFGYLNAKIYFFVEGDVYSQGNRIKKTRKINDLGITRVLAYVYI